MASQGLLVRLFCIVVIGAEPVIDTAVVRKPGTRHSVCLPAGTPNHTRIGGSEPAMMSTLEISFCGDPLSRGTLCPKAHGLLAYVHLLHTQMVATPLATGNRLHILIGWYVPVMHSKRSLQQIIPLWDACPVCLPW